MPENARRRTRLLTNGKIVDACITKKLSKLRTMTKSISFNETLKQEGYFGQVKLRTVLRNRISEFRRQ